MPDCKGGCEVMEYIYMPDCKGGCEVMEYI